MSTNPPPDPYRPPDQGPPYQPPSYQQPNQPYQQPNQPYQQYQQPAPPPQSYPQPPYGSGPPPGYPQYGYPGGPPLTDTTRTLSILGISLSGASVIGFLFTLLGIPLAIAGLVISIIALQRSRRAGTNNPMALIGTILGAVMIVVPIGLLVFSIMYAVSQIPR